MMIISVSGKSLMKRSVAALAAVAVLALIIAISSYYFNRAHTERKINGKTLGLSVRDDKDIVRIAEFFLPDEKLSAPEHTSVTVPYNFNRIYDEYNELQKAFGTDLYDYRGMVCEKYTVRAGDFYDGSTLTLLVCDGLLIGGDLSDNAFDGSVTGLSGLM